MNRYFTFDGFHQRVFMYTFFKIISITLFYSNSSKCSFDSPQQETKTKLWMFIIIKTQQKNEMKLKNNVTITISKVIFQKRNFDLSTNKY